MDAIITIVDVLTGHATNNMVHFIGFKLFTVEEVRKALVYVLDTCEPYDNAWDVLGRSIQQAAQMPVCSAVRYTYPASWLYSASSSLLGWLYVGSAVPAVTIADADTDLNCQGLESTGPISAVCSGIGFGYVLFPDGLLGSCVCAHSLVLRPGT